MTAIATAVSPKRTSGHSTWRATSNARRASKLDRKTHQTNCSNIYRWHRSAWGRYTQADRLGLRGGLNLFSYARSNALTRTDRLGLIVNLESNAERQERINDAILALRQNIVNCPSCLTYFGAAATSSGGDSRYRDLAALIYSNVTPPYIKAANFITDILPNLPPGNSGEQLLSFTPSGQDNIVWILDDRHRQLLILRDRVTDSSRDDSHCKRRSI